jgi:hypothetical protein
MDDQTDEDVQLQPLVWAVLEVSRRIGDDTDLTSQHVKTSQIREILLAEAHASATRLRGALQHLDPDLAVTVMDQ